MRTLYLACPLCDEKVMRTILTVDCSSHALYNAVITPKITWRKCAACGHVFTDGYYTKTAFEIIFSKSHDNQKVDFDLENQRLISARMIEKVLPYARLGHWLDVGFGNGSLLFTAEEFGFIPVGIDFRKDNVESLRKSGIEAHCTQLDELSQPSRYSVVSLADYLEHVPFPGTTLRIIHGLLESEGILFVSMPNMDSILWKTLDESHANPYWGELEHYHNFGRKRLCKLLEDSGFEPIRFGIGERYRVCMEVIARRMEGTRFSQSENVDLIVDKRINATRPENSTGAAAARQLGNTNRNIADFNTGDETQNSILNGNMLPAADPAPGLDSADALDVRGYVLQEQRRHADALVCFDRALALQPAHVLALNNRGNTLLSLERHEEALASYRRALELKPDFADPYNNLGYTLLELGRYEEALSALDHAIALRPDYLVALNNRGRVLSRLRRYEEGLATYERILELMPDDADALSNHGNVLVELQRHEEALASFDRSLAIRPDHFDVLNNRGCILLNLKRNEDALASLDRAIALRPDNPITLNNRGFSLELLRKYDEALASYERAIALDPTYVEALNNCGNALLGLRRPAEALIRYERALELRPDYADALHNRGSALVELGRYPEAARSFARLLSVAPDHGYPAGKALDCRLRSCDWTDYEKSLAQLDEAVAKGKKAAFPFFFLSVSSSAANQLQCARTYVADKHPASCPSLWTGERYQHEKIRLAYLSADFHEHATAYLMAELFETHDSGRFATTAISFGPQSSNNMRDRLTRAFHRFLDVSGKSDREVALMVRELEIDIAVDLKGFTADGRVGIFAHRPAPIQVNYLGYPGTMGADYIDYVIADSYVIPPDQKIHYSEKVVHLPDTYQVNDSKRGIGGCSPSRAELGLPEHGFVFCCFNNNYKFTPHFFDVWMRLLHKVEGSVLWLLGDNAAMLGNLRREAEKRGVASERLVFAARLNLDEHLARQRQADLFLDTLPCNAHTTASDALWAGLPVLTCLGDAFAGRVAASLLNAVGLPELICHTLENYETLALRLATAPAILADIRAKLARNRVTYPLFDANRFCRHIESAYVTMWERYQRGEPPASFAVPAQASFRGR